MIRRGFKFKAIRQQINTMLRDKCKADNFYFLDHENILYNHLWDDGLHLNYDGSKILQQNILECMSSFNPFLCNFDYDFNVF